MSGSSVTNLACLSIEKCVYPYRLHLSHYFIIFILPGNSRPAQTLHRSAYGQWGERTVIIRQSNGQEVSTDSCQIKYWPCVISEFHREVNEICCHVGYYAASRVIPRLVVTGLVYEPLVQAVSEVALSTYSLNHLKTKRRLFYLKTQSVPRCKPFHLGYKNQSVYAVSGTSRCLFSDKYKTYKYSVERKKNSWMLNLLVQEVDIRL
jgi:hypothetical protein